MGALGAVDRRDDRRRVRHAAEGEVRVVGPGGVEVDAADAQDPVHRRLLGVDVLDADDARLLDVLGQDPGADVQPLGADDVARGDALDQAGQDVQAHDDGEGHDADRVRHGEPQDRADDERDGQPPDVEAQDAAPRRVALEDDLLARMQVHGAASLSSTCLVSHPIVQVEPLTTARALRGPFDYVRPDEAVDVGSLLEVPFGRQRLTAVVTGLVEESEHRLVAPLRVLPDALPADLVDLGLWLAREYASTPARALSLMLPPRGAREKVQLWAQRTQDGEMVLQGTDQAPGGSAVRLTAKQVALLQHLPRFAGDDLSALRRLEARGLVAIGPRGRRRAPVHHAVGARRPAPRLNADQQAALDAVLAETRAPRPRRLLLHGVTGSGKTEVYLRAAAETLAQGRGVLILVPEIGLTPQMIDRFVTRFGDTVAVLHSKLGAGERYDEWRRLRSGAARICVGPRSAVFAPIEHLGLVVVDEEHDGSYKNEGDPRYDARLVAEKRALQHGAVLVCGSATPRPESVHALRRIRLPRRVPAAARVRPAAAPDPPPPAGRRRRPAAGRDRRPQGRSRRGASPHPRGARRRAQGDRAAQPPRLVELPDVSDLRARVGVPAV